MTGEQSAPAGEPGTDEAQTADAPPSSDGPDVLYMSSERLYTDDVLAARFEEIATTMAILRASVEGTNRTVGALVDLVDEMAATAAERPQPEPEQSAIDDPQPEPERVGARAEPVSRGRIPRPFAPWCCVRCGAELDQERPDTCSSCGKLQPPDQPAAVE